MSLSRAFTTRMRGLSHDGDDEKTPRRSKTSRGPHGIRNKISAPVELLHTTNMLSYNAPDLPRQKSRSNSLASRSDSDTGFHTANESTPPTSPELSNGEHSPEPEPNHLSCYFKSANASAGTGAPLSADVPAIPKRCPSHTKRVTVEIARQRSISRMSARNSTQSVSTQGGQTFSRPPSTSTRASSASHTSSPAQQKPISAPPVPPPAPSFAVTQAKETHPFGQELAQVTELAEEYSTRRALDTIDEEQQYLQTRGLVKLSADDYLGAISSLSSMFFPERSHVTHSVAAGPLWI